MKKLLGNIIVVLIAGLVGASTGGTFATAHDPSNDIAVRDALIQEQERLLNTYRCMFDIDTQLVPGGCSTTATTPHATPPSAISQWAYFSGEEVRGKYHGYSIEASSVDTSFGSAYLILGCYVADGDRYVRFNTSELLHGDDNKANVVYRTSTETTPTLQTWHSDEEFDSSVFPDNEAQEAEFIRRVVANNDTLFVSFVSRWDGDTTGAIFPVKGAAEVYTALGC